ncbi:hypothetical protein B4102_3528 [Heyndrickxia sporothermodurans]|uniref:Uncharacterized protein n=1 Tax=Heyndrickxia sporothermodurans TaxID=46224 RepID=A0A150KMJ0_9BACI|nr:hypothetical protein [Heyndrickxia sporothermodurans]KYC97014.1 hypothetical protein B4102_3528 [Heyndrickxia sporothermodurans]MED3780030.1 hypothetical protein [Heyndrickxia sporothermodurans]
MKALTGTIALSVSFVLFIYLYGLKEELSVKYTPGLYVFPSILLLIAIICFGLLVVEFESTNSKKK